MQVVGTMLTHLPSPGATVAGQRGPAEGSVFGYWITSSSIAFERKES